MDKKTEKGYSSEDFISKLMNSELARHLFDKNPQKYICRPPMKWLSKI